jgi:hypothetical protein
MALAQRDVRALTGLAVVLVLTGTYYFWPAGSSESVEASPDAVKIAEQRLERLRNIAASAPAKQDVLKRVTAELELRDKSVIRADSAQQAQAETITILRELLNEEGIGILSTELGTLQPLGDEYGLATVSVQLDCRVEQLLNVLSALAVREQLVIVREFQINASDAQRKTIRVRLTAAGVIPKSLLPAKDKKGGSAF